MRFFAAGFMLALMPLLTLAADISGKWKGSMTSGDGSDTVFTLKSDGAKITGSMTRAAGKDAAITKGELQGDKISLIIASEWQGNPVTLTAKGTVSADEIKLTLSNEGGQWSTDLVLKRATE
jgi:hypothetical protein